MARARNLKPSFFTNDVLAECSMAARLLFAGLWTLADREGRLEDRPKKIKAEVLPYDEIDPNPLLNELQDRGFILRYLHHDNAYIQVLNFTKHQNPHCKEQPSTIPAPDMHGTRTEVAGPLPSSPIPLTKSNDLDIPPKSNDDFEKLCWLVWPKPRRCEKPNAKKAWREACRKIPEEKLGECVRRYVETKECKPDKNGEIFAPYPAKWLKRERWLELMEDGGGLSKSEIGISDIGDDTPENHQFLNVLKTLRELQGEAIFRSWTSKLRIKHKNCSVLTLSAPTRFECEWVKTHYGGDVQSAVKATWPEITNIEIQQIDT